MIRHVLLILPLLAGCAAAVNQPVERELGDYELKMSYAPPRSMAQGLVQPNSGTLAHGGLDVTHTSGWYFGQWAANLDPTEGKMIKLDSYTGFKQPLDERFGYELGALLHSYPTLSQRNVEEYYAGLSVFGSRLGAAFSLDPGRSDRTLLADIDLQDDLGFSVTLKYGNHALDNPVGVGNGRNVRVFNDWSINLVRPWLGFDLNLSYSDSSLSALECAAYSGFNRYCDGALTFKASRAL